MSQTSKSSTFIIQNALLAAKCARRAGNHLSIHGLSLAEYLVMHYLNKTPHKMAPRIELAEYIGMSASGITRLIAPMEKNGIVEKQTNARDARQSLVKLSATGQRLYSEASVSFDHISTELTGSLSQGQLSTLLDLYGKLI